MADRGRLLAAFLAEAGWGDAQRRPLADDASFRSYQRLSLGERRAVLIEPSFELLGLANLRDLASRSYVPRQDYQRSIIRAAASVVRPGGPAGYD